MRISLIALFLSVIISCNQQINNQPEKVEIKQDKLSRFYNSDNYSEIESQKVNNWIFSEYKKDTLTGLVIIYNDSVLLTNDNFFEKETLISFKDSETIVFEYMAGDITCKYIFGHNEPINKWLLNYAEQKEVSNAGETYLFKNVTEDENIDILSFTVFSFNMDEADKYVFKNNKYIEQILEQVKEFRAAKNQAFKNIFTTEHAQELLKNYPITLTNVIQINNIAYYLEQMDILMPAIYILEEIITQYPNRIVSYLNISDAFNKLGLKTKAKENYNHYVTIMKQRGKAGEISQREFN